MRDDPGLRTSVHDRYVVVAMTGEFDLGAVSTLRAVLLEALEAVLPPRVFLDLERVSFLDCSALGVLVATSRRAAELGGSLTLASVPGLVRRLLWLTELDGELAMADSVANSVAQALAVAGQRRTTRGSTGRLGSNPDANRAEGVSGHAGGSADRWR